MDTFTARRYWYAVAATLLFGTSALAANPPEDKDRAADNATYEIIFALTGKSKELKPWQFLQLLRIHLTELDPYHLLAMVGCVTSNHPDTSCNVLEDANKSTPNVDRVTSLTFTLYSSDQQAIEPIFREAFARVQKETKDPAFTMTFSDEQPAGPDCASQPQPCYNRPVCTQYGGCSRSQFSCKPCT